MKLIYANVSAGAKVSALQALDQYPYGFTWTQWQAICGSKATASRRLNQLKEAGWIVDHPSGYFIQPPRVFS